MSNPVQFKKGLEIQAMAGAMVGVMALGTANIAREQERERIRRLLHDALSPQLLVALFAIAGAKAKAEEKGHEEAKELARAMTALEEGIDNIVRAAGSAIRQKPRNSYNFCSIGSKSLDVSRQFWKIQTHKNLASRLVRSKLDGACLRCRHRFASTAFLPRWP